MYYLIPRRDRSFVLSPRRVRTLPLACVPASPRMYIGNSGLVAFYIEEKKVDCYMEEVSVDLYIGKHSLFTTDQFMLFQSDGIGVCKSFL